MKRVIIFYRSRTGITKNYAEEMAIFFKSKDIEYKVINVLDFQPEVLYNTEIILLGCYTAGIVFFAQHPDKYWKEFAKQLPDLNDKKIGLFTTYKVATGSMFRNMKKRLSGKIDEISIEIKSGNGELSEQDKILLEKLIL